MHTYVCQFCRVSFQNKKLNRKYCSLACRDRAAVPSLDKLIRIFWSRVNKKAPNGCWLWTAGKIGTGYGSFHRRYTIHGEILAHRISWILANGTIPAGSEVCHDCPGGDNPACVNPAHLFLGTHKENMQDAFNKGRMKDRDANPKCKGSDHGNAKLTEDDVRQMRRDYAAGTVTMAGLAERYHLLSPSTVNFILKRKTWTHV